MISKFFTIQHTAEAKKILNLRAAQLVNIFLKESADKDLKNRIHEYHLGQTDDSISLITDKPALDQISLRKR